MHDEEGASYVFPNGVPEVESPVLVERTGRLQVLGRKIGIRELRKFWWDHRRHPALKRTDVCFYTVYDEDTDMSSAGIACMVTSQVADRMGDQIQKAEVA